MSQKSAGVAGNETPTFAPTCGTRGTLECFAPPGVSPSRLNTKELRHPASPLGAPSPDTPPDGLYGHFGQLGFAEQIKDAVFVALCEIARQWIVEV
jgi:hypothetical protein